MRPKIKKNKKVKCVRNEIWENTCICIQWTLKHDNLNLLWASYSYIDKILDKWYANETSYLFLYPRKGISSLHGPIINLKNFYNKLSRSLLEHLDGR